MQEKNIILTHEMYEEGLAQIDGKDFTYREIDIVACLLHFEQSNEIAQFLYIDKRTVSAHIKNIKKTLQLNSTKQVLNFIKDSDKFAVLKNEYWPNLCVRVRFERILRKLSRAGKRENFCYEAHYQAHKNVELLINQTKKHLKDAGIRARKKGTKNYQPLADIFPNVDETLLYTIYLLPEDLTTTDNATLSTSKIVTLALETYGFSGKLTFLCPKEKQVKNVNRHLLFEKRNYYISFFEILKEIYEEDEISKFILEFKEGCKGASNETRTKFSQSLAEQQTWMHENLNFSRSHYFLRKRNRQIFVGIFLFSFIAAVSLFFTYKNKDGGTQKVNFYCNSQQFLSPIRSDLILPNEAILLSRFELIQQLDKKFKKQKDGVQTVAIIGAGGAGKTILAHQYVHQQQANIIWELNAESKRSIIESFENLAYALSSTNKEKEIFSELQKIKNLTEREVRFREFVKGKLRQTTNWFLIYDNVEDFNDIRNHFPQDSKTWGSGRVLLTTRDDNVRNNKYINSTLAIGELDSHQKLSLLMKIMAQESQAPIEKEQVAAAKKFLELIPPFPLDVILAAYYIKTTNIGFDRYVKLLKYNDSGAELLQESILKGTGDYTKTRYKLVALSIENLMKIHKDFGKLLLFIGLLGPQDIPKELLDKYISSSTVDSFIFHLKRHSLVTTQSSPFLGSTLSFHRSMQALMLAYISQKIDLQKEEILLNSFAVTLGEYIEENFDRNDVFKCKHIISHLKRFLSHDYLLTISTQGLIESKLGCIYSFLGFIDKAISSFEKGLLKLRKNEQQNYEIISHNLLSQGRTYGILGNFKKAEEVIKEGLHIYKQYIPQNKEKRALGLVYLGNLYRWTGEYDKALGCLKESLAIYKDVPSQNCVGKAMALTYLANVYKQLGHYSKAIEAAKHSVKFCKEYLPQGSARLATALGFLGEIYRELGDYKKAITLLDQGLTIGKKLFSQDSIYIGSRLVSLSTCYCDLGQYEQAIILANRALSVYKKGGLKDFSIRCIECYECLGNAYKGIGKYKEARNYLALVLKFYQTYSDNAYVKTAQVLKSLGELYYLEEDLGRAEIFFNESLEIYRKNKHPNEYTCLENFSRLYLKKTQGTPHQHVGGHNKNYRTLAFQELKEALKIVEAYFPKDSPHKFRIQQKLKTLKEG